MTTAHPTLDQITSLVDGTLSSREGREVKAHLASGCSRCENAAARARTTLDALREHALTPAPPVLVERALEALRARRAPAGALARRAATLVARIATLVLDSGRSPAPAGVRSSAAAAVRQLVYEWDADRFTVRVQRSGSHDRYEIMGQVLLTEGVVGGLRVTLRPEKGRSQRVLSESTGEFLFANVPAGSYSILVECPGGTVSLPGIELI